VVRLEDALANSVHLPVNAHDSSVEVILGSVSLVCGWILANIGGVKKMLQDAAVNVLWEMGEGDFGGVRPLFDAISSFIDSCLIGSESLWQCVDIWHFCDFR